MGKSKCEKKKCKSRMEVKGVRFSDLERDKQTLPDLKNRGKR